MSHRICKDQLERALDVLVGCLGVGPLTDFSHGANVVQTLPVEVPIRRGPTVAVAAVYIASSGTLLPLTRSNEKKYGSFSSSWSGSVKLFASSYWLCLSKMDTTPLSDACLPEKRFHPKPSTINTEI